MQWPWLAIGGTLEQGNPCLPSAAREIPGKGPGRQSSPPKGGLDERLLFSRHIHPHLHQLLISRAAGEPDLVRSCTWLAMTPGPLCCLQGTGALVVCCSSMLLGQDLSFVSLSTPLLPSVTLDEDFVSHPVWNSTTAAWSWLSYCCLTFSLPAAFKPPGWDVSGTCGLPQVAKSLLEST